MTTLPSVGPSRHVPHPPTHSKSSTQQHLPPISRHRLLRSLLDEQDAELRRVGQHCGKDNFNGMTDQPPAFDTKLTSVRFPVEEVRIEHQTHHYRNRWPIFRRGASFKLDVSTTHELILAETTISVVLRLEGSTHQVTEMEVTPSPQRKGTEGHEGAASALDLSITASLPANTSVGRYKLLVKLIRKGHTLDTHSYEQPVFVICNPWADEDEVYCSVDSDRAEYLLEEQGLLATGTVHSQVSRPWNFGQFNSKSLLVAMALLQGTGVPVRSSAIAIAKQFAIACSCQNGVDGILMSSSDCTKQELGQLENAPWLGSSAILQQYLDSRVPVKGASPWVHAAVFTSLCRTVGIPCRPITVFEALQSPLHPLGGRTPVAIHLGTLGERLVHDELTAKPRIFGARVLAEVFLQRLDLTTEDGSDVYDGWQCIDPTPQFTPTNVGPAPVSAIKNQVFDIGNDIEALHSIFHGQVKAVWQPPPMDDDADTEAALPKLVYNDVDRVGSVVVTKTKSELQMTNITDSYKQNVTNPQQQDPPLRGTFFDGAAGDVRVRGEMLSVINGKGGIVVGQNLDIVLAVSNQARPRAPRDVVVAMHIHVVKNDGQIIAEVAKVQQTVHLTPTSTEKLSFTLTASKYLPHMFTPSFLEVSLFGGQWQPTAACCHCIHRIVPYPIATESALFGEVLFEPTPVIPRAPVNIGINFTNPLTVALQQPSILIDGPGFSIRERMDIPSLQPGEKLDWTTEVIAAPSSAHYMVIALNCANICDFSLLPSNLEVTIDDQQAEDPSGTPPKTPPTKDLLPPLSVLPSSQRASPRR